MSLVARQVARTNRNLLLFSALTALTVLGAAAAANVYYLNYFAGARTTSLEALAADRALPSRYFVTVEGAPQETGFDAITRKLSKYTREEIGREVTARYLLMQQGDRTLVVKAPPKGELGNEVTGYLREQESSEREVFSGVRADDPELLLSPWVLDATGFRTRGTVGLVAMGLGLFIAWVAFSRWSKRGGNPKEHPLHKRLAALGDPAALAAKLDAEAPAARKVGRVSLTPSFVLHERTFGFDVIPCDQLVWIFKKVTAHKKAFVTVSRTYEALLRARDGEELTVAGKEKVIDELLQEVLQRAPYVVGGYSEELERLWQKERGQLVAAVDARRLQGAAGKSA